MKIKKAQKARRVENPQVVLKDLQGELARLRALRVALRREGSPKDYKAALFRLDQAISETLVKITDLSIDVVHGDESYD
jgi:hypothetical protein